MLRVESLGIALGKGRTRRQILKSVSFTAAEGSITCIMGKSGAGKTTLLNLLAMETTPDTGKICWNNASYGTLSKSQRNHFRLHGISRVFQNYSLIESLTAAENIMLIGELQGQRKQACNEQTEYALKTLGMLDVRNSFPSQMSGGEQQRTAIARALVSQANLVLADEPTGALDSKMSRQVCKSLRILAERGKTVVLVTHDHDVAQTSDTILTIRDGKLS
ncbi:ABC transporter ATP-binding protein [Gleimia hominis]|uniref:ABC transporter ATP-binding protein n=1 Tax=Gleimia hominis TaxID=595468 RepID=A0ABU3ICI5_9ACTO|nr:ABC transporter ATP-binding protein [Gleimia hominis]MDT3768076.1 ABC transporter ATP-binding protein [Gleimia hominis]